MINPEISYSFLKRYSDFPALEQKLRKDVKARPPALPPKQFIVPAAQKEENLKKRAEGLVKWLMVVTNEKMFHCEELFEFIKLPEDQIGAHLAYHPLERLSRNYSFTLQISKSSSIRNESEDGTFVLYFVTVQVHHKDLKNLICGYEVCRRYREFDSLHAELRRKFRKYKDRLPDMASKISFLKPSNRQLKLETYLKKLVSYPDILDCISFRKFLELHPKRFKELNLKKVV